MKCPACDTVNETTARQCFRCKEPLNGQQGGSRMCQWTGCRLEMRQQVAGMEVCTDHYHAWMDAHPECKSAVTVIAEQWMYDHDLDRRDGESLGDYLKRTASARAVGGPGSATQASRVAKVDARRAELRAGSDRDVRA